MYKILNYYYLLFFLILFSCKNNNEITIPEHNNTLISKDFLNSDVIFDDISRIVEEALFIFNII